MNIMLHEIIQLSPEEWNRTVIRFNDKNDKGNHPIDDWLIDRNESLNWTYHRNHKFYDSEILISFFNISRSSYLLVGVDEIHGSPCELSIDKDRPLDRKCVTPIEKFKNYIGRLVVTYENKVRGGAYSYQHVKQNKILPQVFVKEILSEEYSLEHFPGYKNVNLNFRQLQYICHSPNAEDWKTALSNQMGIYLISDSKEKKIYVGSAYGKEMLFQRWKCYADTCHGNNCLLKNLYNNYGERYFVDNMHYSILEHWSTDQGNDINYATSREKVWKDRLFARDGNVGYNKN